MFLTGKEILRHYDNSLNELNKLGLNSRRKIQVATTVLILKESGEYEILKSRHLLTRDEYNLYYNPSYPSYEKYLKEFIGEFEIKTPSQIREMDIKDFERKNIIIRGDKYGL